LILAHISVHGHLVPCPWVHHGGGSHAEELLHLVVDRRGVGSQCSLQKHAPQTYFLQLCHTSKSPTTSQNSVTIWRPSVALEPVETFHIQIVMLLDLVLVCLCVIMVLTILVSSLLQIPILVIWRDWVLLRPDHLLRMRTYPLIGLVVALHTLFPFVIS
jgi:hypothetical protein